MKIILLLWIAFLSMTIAHGQTRPSIKPDTSKSLNQTVTAPTQVNLNMPSTLQIRNISDRQDSPSFIEKNMPWIAALLIGLLSVFVNFGIARKLRKSNETNLQRQLDTAKETTLTQFKATINTKNRQEWLNDLRHTISQFLANATQMVPGLKATFGSPADKNIFLEKMSYAKAKIDLLTNEDKAEQKALLTAIDKVIDAISKEEKDFKIKEFQTAREDTIKASRKLFGIHWQKIKDLK